METCSLNKETDNKYIQGDFEKSELLNKYLPEIIENANLEAASVYFNAEQFENGQAFEIKLGDKSKLNEKYYSYPVLYQRKPIATLRLTDNLDRESRVTLLPSVTQKIALLIKRYQASELPHSSLGEAGGLSGYSPSLLRLEGLIEKASSARCPVIIKGPEGSEKLAVANTIHMNSGHRNLPFIEVNCATQDCESFKIQLLECIRHANGGTVFINGVDELSAEQQNILAEFFSSRQRISDPQGQLRQIGQCRLLVSISQSLDKMVHKGEFSRQLYSQFNFLNLEIPPLFERKDDIAYIANRLLDKYRLFPEQCFSEDVIRAFETYHWPGNVVQLERIIANVVCLSGSPQIQLKDVEIFGKEILDPVSQEVDAGSKVCLTNLDDLTQLLFNQEYEALDVLHGGLNKALRYLGQNYSEDISLTGLASQAFVSASHLSFLFKSNLNTTFKAVLASLRVCKAKEIFRSQANVRITDVCLEVGFGDLSHFEKIFKRRTGYTPRDYKNSHKPR